MRNPFETVEILPFGMEDNKRLMEEENE